MSVRECPPSASLNWRAAKDRRRGGQRVVRGRVSRQEICRCRQERASVRGRRGSVADSHRARCLANGASGDPEPGSEETKGGCATTHDWWDWANCAPSLLREARHDRPSTASPAASRGHGCGRELCRWRSPAVSKGPPFGSRAVMSPSGVFGERRLSMPPPQNGFRDRATRANWAKPNVRAAPCQARPIPRRVGSRRAAGTRRTL